MPNNTEGWEEEFDKEFGLNHGPTETVFGGATKVKDFIRKLLADQRERDSKEIVECCDQCAADNHYECTGCRCHADY